MGHLRTGASAGRTVAHAPSYSSCSGSIKADYTILLMLTYEKRHPFVAKAFLFVPIIYSLILYILQHSWARVNFIAARQRRRDNVTELLEQEKSRKNVKVMVSKWTSRSEYCNIAITNNLSRQCCRVPSSADTARS